MDKTELLTRLQGIKREFRTAASSDSAKAFAARARAMHQLCSLIRLVEEVNSGVNDQR